MRIFEERYGKLCQGMHSMSIGEGTTPTSIWFIEITPYSRMEVGTYHYDLCSRFAPDRKRESCNLGCCGPTHKVSSFTPIKRNFRTDQYAQYYLRDIVKLLGVLVSVVSIETLVSRCVFRRASKKLWARN